MNAAEMLWLRSVQNLHIWDQRITMHPQFEWVRFGCIDVLNLLQCHEELTILS